MRRQLGRYPGYSPRVDPSIANVFATAAYRFAHLAIQPALSRLDGNYREDPQFPSVPLFQAFFTPWRIVFEGEWRADKRGNPLRGVLWDDGWNPFALPRWNRLFAAWFDWTSC